MLQLTVEQIFLLASTVKCFREGSQTSEKECDNRRYQTHKRLLVIMNNVRQLQQCIFVQKHNVKMDFFISPELFRPFTPLFNGLSAPRYVMGGLNLLSSVIYERSLVLTYLFYYKTPTAMLPKYFILNFCQKPLF